MSGPNSVARRVKRAIIQSLGLEIAEAEIADDEVLFGGGMAIDSVASLEIVAAIEREFDLKVPDEDLTADLFDSVATLVEYVELRLQEAGSPDSVCRETR